MRAAFPKRPLDCWLSNFIARIRYRWGALRSYVRRPWRLSWISRRNTASPHYGTALRTWKRNARLRTVSKRDRCSRLISACYSDQLGCLDFLNRVFPRVYISNEVHHEVVVAGAGLPGASEVSKAEWIEVKRLQNPAGLHSAQRKYGLGPGEMSAILLAKELGANPVLLDDYRARNLAKA